MPRMGGFKGSGGGAIRTPNFLPQGVTNLNINDENDPPPLSSAQKNATSSPAPQSASNANKLICGTNGCTRQFSKDRYLKRHREADHEYCAKCDIAFEDNDALILHRITNIDQHIACPVCGIEFQSPSGCNRHFQQMHKAKTEVKCRSCTEVFSNGAGLIQHIESGRCGQKEGQGISNREIFKFQISRAKVNWDMQQIQQNLPEQSYGGTITGTSIDGDESRGGVMLPSLLDEVDDDDARTTMAPSDQTAAGSMAAFAAKRGPTPGKPNLYEWPEIGGKPGQESKHEKLGQNRWTDDASKALFPDAKSTPVPESYQPSQSLSLFSEREVMNPITKEKTTMLELELPENNIDGYYNCPFNYCDYPASKTKDVMWTHIREHHHGFQLRCPNCSKQFKTPSALTAHLESPSMRCFAREREGFGNVITLATGGYLKIDGRHEDGTHRITGDVGGEGPKMLGDPGDDRW